MNALQKLAAFAVRATDADLAAGSLGLLKRNVLDGLGCAIGALDGPPVRAIRDQVEEFGGRGLCTLIGGGRTSPDRAALYNGALVRYLDFMDNFLAGSEICHPSDNLAALLAAAEYAGRSGGELLTALAVSYQVQCRLTEAMPAMERGLNHTTQQALSVAAGVARLLGLDAERTAHAVAVAAADSLALAVAQAEPVSNWKGLSSADTAMHALHNTFLARRGVTGPIGLIDGPKGLEELLGRHLGIDWDREGLDVAARTSLKKYEAEVQSQATIEGTLELREENGLRAGQVDEVTVDVPRGAYEVIGGGLYGDKSHPQTKEQADHNLRYLVAVALIDGEVGPAQYAPERINREDVQSLLRRVAVRSKLTFTWLYPKEMPSRITIRVGDGRLLQKGKSDYEGFWSRPMTWERVAEKFHRLAAPYADEPLRREVVSAVEGLASIPVSHLTGLLARVGRRDATGPGATPA